MHWLSMHSLHNSFTLQLLLKGALDARGHELMPDKINFGISFACDGPTRGGTCDISAWDSFYLAGFWWLNKLEVLGLCS